MFVCFKFSPIGYVTKISHNELFAFFSLHEHELKTVTKLGGLLVGPMSE